MKLANDYAQTDLNINPTDSVKPAENNDTVDNLLTQPSDIPVYDVLQKTVCFTRKNRTY